MKTTFSSSVLTFLLVTVSNRQLLEKITLTIVTGSSGFLDLAGHELRVKDFADLRNLDNKQPKKAPATTRNGADSQGLPASPR